MASGTISRGQLIDKLNEDLAREYQAIIAYVIYSQVLKGAEYMNIAKELEKHAAQELAHALKHLQAHRLPRRHAGQRAQARQDPEGRARHAARRPRQRERDRSATTASACAKPSPSSEYAIAEDIREILREEQEHQIDLATALGEEVPDVSKSPARRER